MAEPHRGRLARVTRLDTDHLFASVTFATIFALSMRVGIQSDTWWLLRTGKEIVRTHRPVTTELWSITARGRYWPNHETLSEVAFYGLHRIGGMLLLATACAALLTWSWWLVYRMCAGPPRFRAAAVVLGAWAQAINYGLRPLLFTMVLFVVALQLVLRRDRHWWLPPLFLLWANTHGGVAFGGLLLVVSLAVAWFVEPTERRHWAAVTVTSGAVTLLNPLGIGLWGLVVHTYSNGFLRLTSEWKGLSIHDAADLRVVALIVVAGACLAATARRLAGLEDWIVAALTVVLAVLSVRAVRNAAILAPVAAIAIARAFAERAPSRRPDASLARVHAVTLVVVVVGLAVVVAPNVPTSDRVRPLSADVAVAIERCNGPLFTTFNNGGVLLWWLPDQPVFVDNRQDPYPQSVLFDAYYASSGGDYAELFAQWDIACAFLETEAKLTAVLQADGWAVTAADEDFTVLERQ